MASAEVSRVERDAVLDACRRVGKRLGVRFLEPGSRGKTLDEHLRRIALVSGVPFRRVHLEDGWWRRDGGPILARTVRGDRVVALLPTSPTSYGLSDPFTGRSERVNREVAHSLDPIAYAFSRPFPNRRLTAWDVLRFEIVGWKRDILTVLAMGVAGALIGFVVPVASGLLFDRIIPGAARDQLAQLTAVLLACAVAACTFRLTKAIALTRIEGRADATVSGAMVDRVLALPAHFFRQFTEGDLADRTLGLSAVRQMVSGITLQSMLAGIFSCFYLVLLLVYDWKLTLVATGLMSVTAVCSLAVSRWMIGYQRKIAEMEGRISGLVYQLVSGVSQLRTTASEDRALSVWARRFLETKGLVVKARKVGATVGAFSASYSVMASMVVFWWVAVPGARTFTTGKFFAFMAAYSSMQNALLQMAAAFGTFLTAVPLLERAKPILETRPEVGAGARLPGRLEGKIEVQRLKFRYSPDASRVLDDVSLTLEPGEFVGIVGASGAGKSTLIRLLLGFEKPESGEILYDGQPLDELNLRALRSQLGAILQNGMLLRGSLFRNIVGAADLSMDDAWRAARMAGLEKDIEGMPMGMHTVVGPAGGGLSGGQRQKLMIARALVHEPRILMWDEATSFLDEQSENRVNESVCKLGITRIVLAQRPSTVMNADRILVMERGRFVESGTFSELSARKGSLWERPQR